jgi:DNA-binding response OmpR family regulator
MSSRKPVRILVIEDDDDSRLVLAALLRHAGFDVVAYAHCAPAEAHLVEAGDDAAVDIALLDVRLPGRCGDDFAVELRARCPKTMIVFVTAEALIEPLKAAVPDCFVIRKPVDVKVLMELLRCFSAESARGMYDGDRMGTNNHVRPAIKPAARVLVLEDDADTLAFLGKLLMMINADAIPTATCEAARYAAATVGPFDVIIADATLPDGDGVALAVALKRSHGTAVVVMTGFEPPAEGLPDGVDLWLVKPVRLPELRRAIELIAKRGA